MADSKIRLVVEAVLKDKALVEAVARTKDLEQQVGRLKQRLAGGSDAAKAFTGELLKFASAGAVWGFLKASTVEFANLERAFAALSFTMRRVGIDADAELPRVRSALTGIAESGGPLVAETLPAFQKFVGITKDVGAAMAAVKLAADMSETGLIDLKGASEGVAAILQGKAKSAAQAFGLELLTTTGHVKTNAEVLDEAIKVYGGFSATTDDARDALDRFAGTWETIKRDFGEAASTFTGVLEPALFHAYGAWKDLVSFIVRGYYDMVSVFTGIGKMARVAFDFKTLFNNPSGYFEALRNYSEATRNAMDLHEREFWDKVVQHHTRAAHAEIAIEDGQAKLREQARRKDLEEERKAADERAKVAAEAARKRVELEQQADMSLVQARISAAGEGTSERMSLELQLLDEQQKAATAKAREIGAATLAIEEEYSLKRQGVVNRYWEFWADQVAHSAEQYAQQLEEQRTAQEQQEQELLQAQAAVLGEDLAMRRILEETELQQRQQRELQDAEQRGMSTDLILAKHELQKLAVKKKFDKLDKQLKDAERERAVSAMGAAVGALAQAFPQIKAFAIAEALISTYQGAARALADYPAPWSYIVAAATAVAGLARVQQIRSTEAADGGLALGPSFVHVAEVPRAQPELILPLRHPRTDALLAASLEKAARRVGPGGLGAPAGAVIHYEITEEYHLHAVTADDRTLRDLSRKLDVVKRRDLSRYVR